MSRFRRCLSYLMLLFTVFSSVAAFADRPFQCPQVGITGTIALWQALGRFPSDCYTTASGMVPVSVIPGGGALQVDGHPLTIISSGRLCGTQQGQRIAQFGDREISWTASPLLAAELQKGTQSFITGLRPVGGSNVAGEAIVDGKEVQYCRYYYTGHANWQLILIAVPPGVGVMAAPI